MDKKNSNSEINIRIVMANGKQSIQKKVDKQQIDELIDMMELITFNGKQNSTIDSIKDFLEHLCPELITLKEQRHFYDINKLMKNANKKINKIKENLQAELEELNDGYEAVDEDDDDIIDRANCEHKYTQIKEEDVECKIIKSELCCKCEMIIKQVLTPRDERRIIEKNTLMTRKIHKQVGVLFNMLDLIKFNEKQNDIVLCVEDFLHHYMHIDYPTTEQEKYFEAINKLMTKTDKINKIKEKILNKLTVLDDEFEFETTTDSE